MISDHHGRPTQDCQINSISKLFKKINHNAKDQSQEPPKSTKYNFKREYFDMPK